jgi:hypothetical protein
MNTSTEDLRELLAASISAFQAQLAASQRESDRRAAEEERRRMEEERRRAEVEERRRAEAEKTMEDLKRQIRELGKQLGGLGNKFGSFAEGMLIATVKRIFTEELGLPQAAERARSRVIVGGSPRFMEIDVLGYANGERNAVCLAEIKSHLREDGIEQLLRQLAEFPRFFPEHAGKQMYGMIAAVDAPIDLQERVWREGLYLVLMHDDVAELTLPAGFIATNFAKPNTSTQ